MLYKIRIGIQDVFSLNLLSSEAIVKTTEYFMQILNKYINMKHSTKYREQQTPKCFLYVLSTTEEVDICIHST